MTHSHRPAVWTAGALITWLALSSPGIALAARSWKRVPVPGAVCGDGSPYAVWVSPKDPSRITFELMGGGACWNRSTCYGPTFLTPMRQFPFAIAVDAIHSDDPARSPSADDTFVHFPYCTGDVHAGRHVATYGLGAKVRHVGALNFEKAVDALEALGVVRLPDARTFTFYGASAGAMGVLLQAPGMEARLPATTPKTLIADAPGLHFGPRFWDRFPDAWRNDVRAALRRLGGDVDPTDGNLAKTLPAVCRTLSRWNVAFLQGSRDVVMSNVFGTISGREHEKLVYGSSGLRAATSDPNDNCSSWIRRSHTHTFLLLGLTANETAGREPAMEFARDVIEGRGGADRADEVPGEP